jgi:hypothetical protein
LNLPNEATQTNSILFCSKTFGICQQKQLKLAACCSVAQRQFLELRPKSLYFVQPHSERFWNAQSTVVGSATATEILEFTTKTIQTDCIFSKNLGIYQRKQLKLNLFSAAPGKSLEFANENKSIN